MPLYDYKCSEHGVFQEMVPLAQFDQPCGCPQCGALSSRVILMSPEFLSMAEERRKAFQTNERAQHVPKFSSIEIRAEEHKHGKDCCGQKKRGAKLFYTADGGKMFPSARPWMISH